MVEIYICKFIGEKEFDEELFFENIIKLKMVLDFMCCVGCIIILFLKCDIILSLRVVL